MTKTKFIVQLNEAVFSDFAIKSLEDLKVTHPTKNIGIAKHCGCFVEPISTESHRGDIHFWGVIPAQLGEELYFTAKWFRRSRLDHGTVLMFTETKLDWDVLQCFVYFLLMNKGPKPDGRSRVSIKNFTRVVFLELGFHNRHIFDTKFRR